MALKHSERLRDVHVVLAGAVNAVAARLDFDLLVVCGMRGEAEQNAAFAKGNSKLKYPHSKHNGNPSRAVDLAPVKDGKVLWEDLAKFAKIADEMKKLSSQIVWGGDWVMFKDRPHFELKEPKK
jgi:peptidoglycan L-alanyl-D-glutamate endopeptidase CwlK